MYFFRISATLDVILFLLQSSAIELIALILYVSTTFAHLFDTFIVSLSSIVLSVLVFKNISNLELIRKCTQKSQYWNNIWQEFEKRFAEKISLFVYREFRKLNGYKYTNQPDETLKDLGQEVYIRLLDKDAKALKNFKGEHESSFFAYLNQISISVVKNFITHQQTEKRALEVHRQYSQRDKDYLQQEPSDTETGDELEAKFLKEYIINILQKHYKSRHIPRDIYIFKLYYFEGLSPKEIVKICPAKITASGIESLISRMKHFLQEKYC